MFKNELLIKYTEFVYGIYFNVHKMYTKRILSIYIFLIGPYHEKLFTYRFCKVSYGGIGYWNLEMVSFVMKFTFFLSIGNILTFYFFFVVIEGLWLGTWLEIGDGKFLCETYFFLFSLIRNIKNVSFIFF
jgi:hypothetical protein